jgi:all-trans-8'-apo-beta-carotenal 15,15'-oxygenase
VRAVTPVLVSFGDVPGRPTSAGASASDASRVTPRADERKLPSAMPIPPWRRGFEDLAREHAFEPLRVEGRLPEDLCGTLYRNGPGRFGVGGERYRHWFDGDGAVTAVRIGRGRASGGSRMVQTRGYREEQRAGRRLYGGYDSPMVRPFAEVFLGRTKNPGNTSIMIWDDRVFALCEIGLPIQLSDRDLSTLGETDLGVVQRAFSAHPHRVPARRALYGFGLSLGRRTSVEVYELPDAGNPRTLARFSLDGLRMNHDFAVTERHAVFMFPPFYLSLANLLLFGKGPASGARWRPSCGTEVVVVPLDAPERLVRFHVDAFHMEHVVNAWEQGEELIVEHVDYPDVEGLEGFVRGLVHGEIRAPLRSRLRRVTIDPGRRTLRAEALSERPFELPRVSPHVEARRHRYAYFVGGGDDLFDAVLKWDRERGGFEAWSPGPGGYPSEALFVPRDRASGEDDGYLLTMVFDAERARSHLAVLDARHLEDGPLARLHFDHAIPFGFHGAWSPDARGAGAE